jgi:hypothetical protein
VESEVAKFMRNSKTPPARGATIIIERDQGAMRGKRYRIDFRR